MRTYKTEWVGVDAKFRTGTFRDDDIIIMYAIWNLIMKSSSQHEILVSWVRQEVGRVKCVIPEG